MIQQSMIYKMASKEVKMMETLQLSVVLREWYHVSFKPCPFGSQLDHVDHNLHVNRLNKLMLYRNGREDIRLVRLALAAWKLHTVQSVAVRDRLSDICVSMICSRQTNMVSRHFHNWLRLVDDSRMGLAAKRINQDKEALVTLSKLYGEQDARSQGVIDAYNKLLNVSEETQRMQRAFYHWLVRAQQIVNYQAIRMLKKSKKAPSGSSSGTATTTLVSGTITPFSELVAPPPEKVFDAPPWPSPVTDLETRNLVPLKRGAPEYSVVSVPIAFTEREHKSRRPAAPSSSSSSSHQEKEKKVKPPSPSSESQASVPIMPALKRLQKLEPEEPVEREIASEHTPSIQESVGNDLSKTIHQVQKMRVEDEADTKTEKSVSSSSSSYSSESSQPKVSAPTVQLFKLSVPFFIRMRGVVRRWAQRARETVARRKVQQEIDAEVEAALNAWRPRNVPIDILVNQMQVSEALRVFRDGAVLMKRKGFVSEIDVKESWFTFGGVKDQPRYFLGQIDSPDRFLLYYESPKAMQKGDAPKGSFTLDELKEAQFSWQYREIGIADEEGGDKPKLKKISKIPERFFIALVLAIRHAIGASVRKSATLMNSPNQGSGGPAANPFVSKKSIILQ